MKKITALVAALIISIAAFSQQSKDSVVVKMSVEEYNMWNNYVSKQAKIAQDNLDVINKIVVLIKDNIRGFDTSAAFINSRAVLLKDRK